MLLALGGGAVLAFVLVIGWVAFQLNGGWPVPRTDPDDPRIEAALERWTPVWQERHEAMVAELEAAGLVVLAVNEVDFCREGQNNWKVRDGYGLRCSQTWQVVLGAPAGDPTTTVTAVHEVAEAASEASVTSEGPGTRDTFLSNLGYVGKDSTRVPSAYYDGRLSLDGDSQPVRLKAYATRAPQDYATDQVIVTYGLERSSTGPGVRELEQIQGQWVGTGRLEQARWLVQLTDSVDYFTR